MTISAAHLQRIAHHLDHRAKDLAGGPAYLAAREAEALAAIVRTELEAQAAKKAAHRADNTGTEHRAEDATRAQEGPRLAPRRGSRAYRALQAYADAWNAYHHPDRDPADIDANYVPGLTDTDIGRHLGIPRNEAAKRCADLRRAGYTGPTGDAMVTDSIRTENLYAITPAGLAYLESTRTP